MLLLPQVLCSFSNKTAYTFGLLTKIQLIPNWTGIRYAVRPQQQQPQKQLHQQDHQDHQVASTSSQNPSGSGVESVHCQRRTSMVQSQSQQSVFSRTQGINNISERLDSFIL